MLYYRDHSVRIVVVRKLEVVTYRDQEYVCVYVLAALTYILMFRKKNLNAVDCRL